MIVINNLFQCLREFSKCKMYTPRQFWDYTCRDRYIKCLMTAANHPHYDVYAEQLKQVTILHIFSSGI